MLGLDIIGGLISSPPKVPDAPHVDLAEQQRKAVGSNAKALPGIEALGGRVNTFNQDQLTKMLESAIPNYQQLVSSTGGQIQSMVSGQVPKDVQDMLQSSSAGRALQGGYGGTGMSHNLNARDLGLTSLDLVNKGISSAQSWLGTMKSIGTSPQFDVTSMFVTPAMQIQNSWENQNSKFSRNWTNNQLQNAYAPNNIIGSSLVNLDSQLGSVVSSAAGSAAGGGGGM